MQCFFVGWWSSGVLPFASSSASVFCWERFFLVSTAPVATSWLARFGVRFPGLSVSVGDLVALVPVARVPCGLFVVFCLVECSLSACFCLALQVSSHSFHSPRPRSLSLSALLAPALSPLGLFLVGSSVRLCCHRSSCCPSPSFLWHSCWYPSVPVRLSSGSLFPTFLVGSSSSAFTLAPFQSVLLVLSGALVGLPGSLLCMPPGYGSSSSQFPVVWLVLWLPSLRPYTRPLFGL